MVFSVHTTDSPVTFFIFLMDNFNIICNLKMIAKEKNIIIIPNAMTSFSFYLQSLKSLLQTSPLWKPQANAGPIEDLPTPSVPKKSNSWKCFSRPVSIVKRRLGCQSKV